jgi:biofilm PGA synthesis protein PgaD
MKYQRPPKPEITQPPPIIERREAQTLFQKYGYLALTILFWLLFLSLFRIAGTPFAWLLGVQSAYELFYNKVDGGDFVASLSVYALVIILIGVVLIGWARYNQYRFTKKERRTYFLPPVTAGELAEFFSIQQHQVRECLRGQRVLFFHAEKGQLDKIETESQKPLALPQEPVPLRRYRYFFRDYLIFRDQSLQWVVLHGDEELFRAGEFEPCRRFVSSLTRGSSPLC